MKHVYILPDTGGYMYHFLILELSLLRNLIKFGNEEYIYIHIPHLKKYDQAYMYEVVRYFEPDIQLLNTISNIPETNIIHLNEHEPLINENRNKVCNDALFF